MADLLNVFWPQSANVANGSKIRLGRVLHWVFVTFAIPGAVMSFMIATGDSSDALRDGFLIAIPFVLAPALVGRAIRYILSNE